MGRVRIISSFHDYYDISLSYGIDPKCIYKREMEKFSFNSSAYPGWFKICANSENFIKCIFRSYYINSVFDGELSPYSFLFCGKFYFAFLFKSNFYYSSDSILNAISNERSSELRKILDKSPRRYYPFYYKSPREIIIKRYELASKIDSNMITESLRIAGVPIIYIYKENRGIYGAKNPVLRNYQFSKAVDPFTAFQEISMFLTNIIGIEENPTVEVSDKSKLEGHGFDKGSFRHPFK